MKNQGNLLWSILLICMSFWLVQCAGVENKSSGSAPVETGPIVETSPKAVPDLYNRYNIHYFSKENARSKRSELVASYANFVNPANHGMIPVNTPILIGRWHNGFSIRNMTTDEKILFEFKSINMGGMTVQEYIDLIFASQPTLYDQLPEIDRQGILEGRALVGMSKEGVMAALGYPAKHRTPSLEATTWIYWADRFKTLEVHFENNKVVGLGD